MRILCSWKEDKQNYQSEKNTQIEEHIICYSCVRPAYAGQKMNMGFVVKDWKFENKFRDFRIN